MDPKTKEVLLESLRSRVQAEYDAAVASQKVTHQAATHEEARPENDKDTRALEQSYLARGQAERVASLRSDLDQLHAFRLRSFEEDGPIALGAVIELEGDAKERRLYFLAPAGAGEVLEDGEDAVRVLTPRSPLGRALIGKSLGDEVELHTPSGNRHFTVSAIF